MLTAGKHFADIRQTAAQQGPSFNENMVMMQTKTSRPKIYHVVQRPDRLWEVRKHGEQISLHGSELQAVDYAVKMARAGQRIVVKHRHEPEHVPSWT